MRASIVIPTLGTAGSAVHALAAAAGVARQRDDVEILLVDNSQNGCEQIRAECLIQGSVVRYVAEPSPGATAARHRGATEARGELLLFIDDDVTVSGAWLNTILGAFSDPGVGIVGGPSVPVFADSVPSWFWDFLEPTPYGGWCCGWLSLLDIGRDVRDIDPIWIWTLNFAIRAPLLRSFGGFHPDLVPAGLERWQGDGETGLSQKAKLSGVNSVYCAGAFVHHHISPARFTPGYFARRARFQGIAESFSGIRAGRVPLAGTEGPMPVPSEPRSGSTWAAEALEIRRRFAAAFNEGWLFHQREAAADPALVEWIRRPDYFGADLRALNSGK